MARKRRRNPLCRPTPSAASSRVRKAAVKWLTWAVVAASVAAPGYGLFSTPYAG